MFKKILAKFGKGAATVDLQFPNTKYYSNDLIQGTVLVTGGEVNQEIASIRVNMIMTVHGQNRQMEKIVEAIPVSTAFTIHKGETKYIPFTYRIPETLPLSSSTVAYHFDTEVDIIGGVNRNDVDRLYLSAPKEIEQLFEALQELGFREKATSGKLDAYGQEFAFFPTKTFLHELQEIELRFALDKDELHVWLEVDVLHGVHEREVKREFGLSKTVLANKKELTILLETYIEEALRNPHAYNQSYDYKNYSTHHSKSSSGIGGMIGGMAVGLLGGMVLSELMGEAFGEFDELGIEEEFEGAMEEIEELEESDGFDFGDFGGFFGDDE